MADAAPEEEPSEPEVRLPDLAQRIEWFEDWEERTSDAQELSRRDRDYYDNHQWTQDDLDILKKRGQPPLVKNYIAPKVNAIRGEEIRKRIDPVARPRTPQHEDAARAATDALRYVEEEQKFDQVRSAVLVNMLVEGYGGAIKEVEECECQDGTTEYQHLLTHVQWDRLFYDPHSRANDFSDAKYLGIIRWADLDDAIEDYPDSEDDLRAALTKDIGDTGGTTDDIPRNWADRKRKRVKLVEMYFRVGRDWYRSDFTQVADLRGPELTVYLDESGSHSVCPLVMASCYIDQEGMRYGIVRQLISPQDEINKRASKSLHLLNVRQVIAEKDAVPDPEKFQAELAKPDGFAEVAHGRLSDGSVQVSQTGDLAQGHIAMMQEAKQDIDRIGPSSAQIPDLPQGASGRAFIARQQAASQEMGSVFDSLLDFTLAVFTLDWLCIRQFWPREKWLRVTDDQEENGYRFVALNRSMTRAERLKELLEKQPPTPLPKAVEIAAGAFAPVVMAQAQWQHNQMMQQAQATGQPPPQGPQLEQHMAAMVMQNPLMLEEITVNQVDQMLVDIVLDVAPDTAILAQEEFQTLTDLLPTVVQARPDKAEALVKLIVKASSLPDKRALLAELEKGPDPKQQQQQRQAQQIQEAQAKAGIAVSQSQAQLNQARAAQAGAEAQSAGPKAAADIEAKKAGAMHDAAMAGERMGGPMMPPGVM